MMPYVLFRTALFTSGLGRADSEDIVLEFTRSIVDGNMRYLQRHPETPLLYESGVRYALPDQLEECKIDESKLAACRKFLKGIGASDDTIDVMIAFLQGIEVFEDIPTVAAKKEGDCNILAPWRIAELRLRGADVDPCITWRDTDRGTTYHMFVRHKDGTSEDPSILLGMDRGPFALAEERRKNAERQEVLAHAAAGLCETGALTARDAIQRVQMFGYVPRGGWK